MTNLQILFFGIVTFVVGLIIILSCIKIAILLNKFYHFCKWTFLSDREKMIQQQEEKDLENFFTLIEEKTFQKENALLYHFVNSITFIEVLEDKIWYSFELGSNFIKVAYRERKLVTINLVTSLFLLIEKNKFARKENNQLIHI